MNYRRTKEISQKSFYRQNISNQSIMDGRTVSAHKFRTRLGFKHYDVTLTKKISTNKNN